VINVPALGETIYAARGLGCYCNGVPAKVSERGELAGSYLTTSSFGEWDETALLGVRRAASSCAPGAMATATRLSRPGGWTRWPIPGPSLRHRSDAVIISEQAGASPTGKVRRGFDGGSGLATNGRIHSALLRLLGPQRAMSEALVRRRDSRQRCEASCRITGCP